MYTAEIIEQQIEKQHSTNVAGCLSAEFKDSKNSCQTMTHSSVLWPSDSDNPYQAFGEANPFVKVSLKEK